MRGTTKDALVKTRLWLLRYQGPGEALPLAYGSRLGVRGRVCASGMLTSLGT